MLGLSRNVVYPKITESYHQSLLFPHLDKTIYIILYTLWEFNTAIEHGMAIEIVDWPIVNDDFPVRKLLVYQRVVGYKPTNHY